MVGECHIVVELTGGDEEKRRTCGALDMDPVYLKDHFVI